MFVLAISYLDISLIQVPILTQVGCQEKANETIESAMLCAGGEGCGTNKVSWEGFGKCTAAF